MSQLLLEGLDSLKLTYQPQQFDKLLAYINLLSKWNKTYNLTAITEKNHMIVNHLLDGLSIVSYFSAKKAILDVGSGMGVPGIILAIMLPNASITLIDCNAKKTAFLLQAKIELQLNNLQIINKNVKHYQGNFEIITSRAVASCESFIELTKHLLNKQGTILLLKSNKAVTELANLANTWQSRIINIEVPHLNAQRYLVKLEYK